MKALAILFYSNPVVALGVIDVVAVALVAEDLIAAWIGGLVVAIVTLAQRQLVTPEPQIKRRVRTLRTK